MPIKSVCQTIKNIISNNENIFLASRKCLENSCVSTKWNQQSEGYAE